MLGSCLIQRWCWTAPDGEGTGFQLQQSPDYNQTRPRPAPGAKSYTFLDVEPSRPAQVYSVLFLCLLVWSTFPCLKIVQGSCLISGASAREGRERDPCFPLLPIHDWSLVCSHLQPAYSWLFHGWSDVRLSSADTGWHWDEKGKLWHSNHSEHMWSIYFVCSPMLGTVRKEKYLKYGPFLQRTWSLAEWRQWKLTIQH